MKRLSIGLLAFLAGCTTQQQQVVSTIPRPAPDEAAPSGLAYLCDGRKEVSVVYAKNRASVTMGDRTWRLEYQPAGPGFRYAAAGTEWTGGQDEVATLRAAGTSTPLAFNCRAVRRTA